MKIRSLSEGISASVAFKDCRWIQRVSVEAFVIALRSTDCWKPAVEGSVGVYAQFWVFSALHFSHFGVSLCPSSSISSDLVFSACF